LSCHHPPPAKGGEGGVDLPRAAADEPFQDDAEGVRHYAPGCHEEGPEVEGVVPLEGLQDFQVDEDAHVDCEGEHGDEDGGACGVFRERSTDDAAICSREEWHG